MGTLKFGFKLKTPRCASSALVEFESFFVAEHEWWRSFKSTYRNPKDRRSHYGLLLESAFSGSSEYITRYFQIFGRSAFEVRFYQTRPRRPVCAIDYSFLPSACVRERVACDRRTDEDGKRRGDGVRTPAQMPQRFLNNIALKYNIMPAFSCTRIACVKYRTKGSPDDWSTSVGRAAVNRHGKYVFGLFWIEINRPSSSRTLPITTVHIAGDYSTRITQHYIAV